MNNNISVIIPAYNQAELIPLTLDSILDQSFQPREIIVVDDGSTENIFQAVSNYGSKVKYLRIENSGVCKARNTGVAAAKGDWIAFCDHDDLWHRDKLLRQVELIQSCPEIEYCFTNFRIVMNDEWTDHVKFDDAPDGYWDISKTEVTANSIIINEPFYPNVIKFQPIFPSTIMMTKKFFHHVGGFDESFGRKCSEDLEFTLRCTQEKPIGVVKEPVVGIRWHELNYSQGKIPGISFVVSDIEILEHSMEKHRFGADYYDLLAESIIRRSIAVANGAFEQGDFNLMKSILDRIPKPRRSRKLQLKIAISNLPNPLAEKIQQILC